MEKTVIIEDSALVGLLPVFNFDVTACILKTFYLDNLVKMYK